MGLNGFNNLYKKIDSEKYDYDFLSFLKFNRSIISMLELK